MRYISVLFLAALSISDAQRVEKGKCPNVHPLKKFQLANYLGTWYENRRYSDVFEFAQRCTSATYSARSNNSINVLNKAINIFSGTTVTMKGYATLASGDVGQLEVVFPSQNSTSLRKASGSILGTDYKNWAAVYTCLNSPLKFAHASFAWLLTRSRNPGQGDIEAALAAFRSQRVRTEPLRKISQEKCGNN